MFEIFLKRYNAAKVQRYHTVSMIKVQDVAAHSWGVLAIVLHLRPSASIELIKAALYHDLAESITGDLPAPTKWRWPQIVEALDKAEAEVEKDLGISTSLSAEERLVLRIADMTELMLYCHRERLLGNRHVEEILARGADYLMKLVTGERHDTPETKFVWEVLYYVSEPEASWWNALQGRH